jgi:TRAP-type C4-dicarboxylate transport system permease small subunit
VFFLLRLRDWLDAVMGWLLVVLMATVAVVVFLQVFYRYVLNNPLPWPEETARMAVVWLSFVGAYKAMRKSSHIGFNLLVAKLPETWQVCVGVLGDLLVLWFLLVILQQGIVMMILTMQDPMPYTGVSIGLWVYSVFPVAGFCMALDTALKIWSSLPHRGRGKSLGVGK